MDVHSGAVRLLHSFLRRWPSNIIHLCIFHKYTLYCSNKQMRPDRMKLCDNQHDNNRSSSRNRFYHHTVGSQRALRSLLVRHNTIIFVIMQHWWIGRNIIYSTGSLYFDAMTVTWFQSSSWGLGFFSYNIHYRPVMYWNEQSSHVSLLLGVHHLRTHSVVQTRVCIIAN
jgi:hypothetical protein